MSRDNVITIFEDQRRPLEMLNDIELGRLIHGLMEYKFDGVIPDFADGNGKLEIAFEMVKSSSDKYSGKKNLNNEMNRLKAFKRDYGIVEMNGVKTDNEIGKMIQGLLADLKDFRGSVREFRLEHAGQYKRILKELDEDSKFYRLISEDISGYPKTPKDILTIQNSNIQNDTVQLDTVQNETVQYGSNLNDSVLNDSIPDYSELYKPIQSDSIQDDSPRYDAVMPSQVDLNRKLTKEDFRQQFAGALKAYNINLDDFMIYYNREYNPNESVLPNEFLKRYYEKHNSFQRGEGK